MSLERDSLREPALPDLSPGNAIGKYRIERVVGEGAMGLVVEATNLDLDEHVALKFMRPSSVGSDEALDRFAREARAAAKLKSEHVARVFDVASFGGAPFIVMEFLEGRDLAALIEERGVLPIGSTVLYVVQACEALAEAHSRGIVHRDIKPANIFIVERGGWRMAKVLDFGVSKSARRASDSGTPSLKDTCGLVGSPFYMAPERFRAAAEASPVCDTWSLGVVLYEALTGKMPFEERGGLAQLMNAVVSEAHVNVRTLCPEIPESLARVIDWCLEKDPARRCPSTAALAHALLAYAPHAARLPAERARALLGVSERLDARASVPPPSVPPPPVTIDRSAPQSMSPDAINEPVAPRASLGRGFGLAAFGVMALTCVGIWVERGRHAATRALAPTTIETQSEPEPPPSTPEGENADSVAATVVEVPNEPGAAISPKPRAQEAAPPPSPQARAHRAPTRARASTPAPAEANASVDAKAVNAVVRTHAAELQSCVATARDAGDVRGRLAVTMTLESSGKVTRSRVAQTTTKNEKLERCVLQAVKGWQLPAPATAKSMNVTYTFVFE